MSIPSTSFNIGSSSSLFSGNSVHSFAPSASAAHSYAPSASLLSSYIPSSSLSNSFGHSASASNSYAPSASASHSHAPTITVSHSFPPSASNSYGPPSAGSSSLYAAPSGGSSNSYAPPSAASSHSFASTSNSHSSNSGSTILNIKPSGLPENSYIPNPKDQVELYAPQYSGYLGPPPMKFQSLQRPVKSTAAYLGSGYKYGGNFNGQFSQNKFKIPFGPPPKIQHNTNQYSIPPLSANQLNQKPIFNTHSISAEYGHPGKLVTPTSNEYIPPPQQLPIAASNHPQEEIPQETSIVHIPVYDNNNNHQNPLILTAGISFPELNQGPVPPIHHAQPFYIPAATQPHDHQASNNVKQIEIHESDNGNLQYLTNFPNVEKTKYLASQGNEHVNHNEHLIKHVISEIPDKIVSIGREPIPKHIDTSHSESQHNANVNGILVPPPPPPQAQFLRNNFKQTFHQGAASSHNFQQTANIQQIGNIQHSGNNLRNIGSIQHSGNILGNNVNNQYTEVKVVQSIPIAEFTSSIEYPVSIQQSSITDVVAEKDVEEEEHHHDDAESLSSNPIVVTQDATFDADDLSSADIDSHLAEASSLNITIKDTRQSKETRDTPEGTLTSLNQEGILTSNQTEFIAPTKLDFSSWHPSETDDIPTAILPPSVKAQDTWTNPKMPTKQIQIIIPYTSNNYPTPFGNNNMASNTNWIQEQQLFLNGQYQAKLPENMDPKVFMTPPPMDDNSQLLWLTNIRNEVADNAVSPSQSFDILRLQKNIDNWTAQEYSQLPPSVIDHTNSLTSVTTGQLVPSKKIPEEYLTTTSLSNDINVPTELPQNYNFNDAVLDDYEVGASIRHSVHLNIPEYPNHKNSSKITILPIRTTTKAYHPEETTTSVPTTENYPDSTWETTTLDTTTTFDDYDSTEDSVQEPSRKVPVRITTQSWNQAQVSISPLTQEKVYVVTPQPWNPNEPTPASAWDLKPDYHRIDKGRRLAINNDNFDFVSPRFISRPTPGVGSSSTTTEATHTDEKVKKHPVKIIYSEWPQSSK